MNNVGAVAYRDSDKGLEITCNSWVSGTVTTLTLSPEYKENFLKWWNGKVPLNEALPSLTAEEEELILTGILPGEDEIENMTEAADDMSQFDRYGQPYSPDERRVVEYILKITNNQIGAGNDPIGFLIASHAELSRRLNQAKKHVTAEQYRNICYAAGDDT